MKLIFSISMTLILFDLTISEELKTLYQYYTKDGIKSGLNADNIISHSMGRSSQFLAIQCITFLLFRNIGRIDSRK
jgi:hypothetical protein